ncbi:preprotein translocase subunit YajC [Williamsia herbipolensis]|uniref:Preprotein translocase subunit YajC n=1 Tax=Williamsia herbipolensis TaxID=1603258 RepID=A0AAU4K3C3_9NOCA|nr:preprotein translocase subunit YajC [Williamsia herbipolensis]MCX6470890.1 preprotein translocase subunit YajC [Mycobacteriales bacterium]
MELLFPIVLVVLVGFMFLSVRRQKKAAAQVQEMQDALQPGARVQTTSGMYGTVVGLADGVVDLELAPGVVVRWNRLAVREVVHADDLAGSFPGADTTPADAFDEDDDTGFDADVDRPITLDKKADSDS